MMVLLVTCCTVEVVSSNEAVGTIALVGTVKVVGVVVVLGTDEVDIINGRDIIDEVVNTVDVSDTDDE